MQPPTFLVEVQHDGLVAAKRASHALAWFLMLATPAAAFLPGLQVLDRQENQGLYVTLWLVGAMVSMFIGFLLFALTHDLIPRLYLKLTGNKDIRRQGVAVSVDEAGIHIEGLETVAWPDLVYTAPVRGDDYNGDDLTLSSPGRPPVIIRSSEHIDALSADIKARQGPVGIEAGTIRPHP